MSTMNSDQVFSMVRQMMTALSGVLLGSLEANLQNLVISLVPLAASVTWSLWRNLDNTYDLVFSAMRQAVLAVGAYAAAKGWLAASQVEYLAGAVFAVISSVMSFWFYRDAPGPLLPGTTITDDPE